MEEIFDAMGSLLASNYSGEAYGPPNETKEALIEPDAHGCSPCIATYFPRS